MTQLLVNDLSEAVRGMGAAWQLTESLLGGTAGMRLIGPTFLPKWPQEDYESYRARLNTSTLLPVLSRTLSVMVGKPFSKQLTFSKDTPDQITGWMDNCDLQGNNLHSFASVVLHEALAYGLCGIMVDYQRIPDVQTLADERALNLRPYLVFITHDQILGWRCVRDGGAMRMTQLRIKETHEADDGTYGTKVMQRVRVYEPGLWRLYEDHGLLGYQLIDEGVTTLKEVPFVPVYGFKKDFMMGESPLINLAYLNIKHWQKQSDLDNIVHVASVPILVLTGAEPDTRVTIGSSTAVSLPLSATMHYVEHSGAAIAAGEASLEKLEDQMLATGAEMLKQKAKHVRTATEANNEAEANKCDLQRIVETFEDSLDQVTDLMADWAKITTGSGTVTLFKDFAASSLTDASAQLVIALQQGGIITKETVILEQQRRGLLSPDIVPADELEKVNLEGPPPGLVEHPEAVPTLL